MIALIVILCVLAAVLLISLIRVGAEVTYTADGFTAWAKVLFFRVKVFPGKPKGSRKKPKKAKEKPQVDKGGLLSALMATLPDITKAVGKLFRKLRIDDLDVALTWAAADPADAALGYGRANAALATLDGVLEENFNVRHKSLSCGVDFDVPSPLVILRAALTLNVGQVMGVALPVLIAFLKNRSKTRHKTGKNLRKEAKA